MTAAPRKPGGGWDRARDGGDRGPRQTVVVDPDNTLMAPPDAAASLQAELLFRLQHRPGPSSVAAAFGGFRPVWAEEAARRCESAGHVELVRMTDDGPVYRVTESGRAIARGWTPKGDIRPR